ncbi:MAG TPA: 1-acyl-sn-glycerol-3-phosphate acyltransferase [Mycobacteriales bacterium]|nr:1-acyl-sn-glycerol-3-phosphate acyltransferase [Mycobacteriales bacterium]
MPPRWVRRPLGLLLIAAAVLAATALPLLLLGAALASLFVPGRWRPLRVLTFTLVYLAIEVAGLAVAFALWVASGFGWKLRSPAFQRAHYAVLHALLAEAELSARLVFKVRMVTDGASWSPVDDGVPGSTNAMIVLSRHAGPGDSFLLVRTLLNRDHLRRPRIVLKETLQLDPLIDVYLNRLPNYFVPIARQPGADPAAGIGKLAQNLGDEDALLIFPEGGNFTPRRRRRAIDKLRALGRRREAAQAAAMEHVLAPRAAGVQAALAAAPHADVVFVAHTGLERFSTIRDLYRGIPMDTELRMRWEFIPAADVPRDAQSQVDWLYHHWAEIDSWIDQHVSAPVAPSP